MEELTLSTPSLLFSAISLIMLAYTNRFLSYAQLIRTLAERYLNNPTDEYAGQMANLRKRIYLTRIMQILGIFSLFLCCVSMFFVYFGYQLYAFWCFAIAILSLAVSLALSIYEIVISANALNIFLDDIERHKKGNQQETK